MRVLNLFANKKIEKKIIPQEMHDIFEERLNNINTY